MSGKAKRARERKRMETKLEVLERVGNWIEDGVLLANANNAEYTSCRLDTEHAENCDGSCPRLNKWEVALSYEKQKLLQLGVDVDKGLAANSFITDIKLNTLLKMLEDAGVINHDELEQKFQQLMYETLYNIRIVEVPKAKQQMLKNKIMNGGRG
jgi:hypothetical protein